MTKPITVGLFYLAIAFMSVFLFMTLRWNSYKTPDVNVEVREENISMNDKRLVGVPDLSEDKYYYVRITTTTTVQAGKFPFVDKNVVVKEQMMYRNIWNKYQ